MNVLLSCMSAHGICSWLEEDGPSDPLSLELQVVVSCCVGAGNRTHDQEQEQLLLTTGLSLQPTRPLLFVSYPPLSYVTSRLFYITYFGIVLLRCLELSL